MFAEQTQEKDIFDRIELDIFDLIDSPKLKEYVPPPRVQLDLSDEIRQLVKNEITASIKKAVLEAVKDIKPIEKTIIEKTVVDRVTAPEKVVVQKIFDEEKISKIFKAKIKEALDDFEKSGRGTLFIPAPVGLPNMAGQSGKVLSTDGNQTRWIAASSGSGIDPATDVTLTGAGVGLVVTTPDGTHTYRIAISDDGVITTEQVS